MINRCIKVLIFFIIILFACLNLAYDKYYKDLNRLSWGKQITADNTIQQYSKKLFPRDFLLNHCFKYQLLNAIRLSDTVSIKTFQDKLWSIDSQNYQTINLFKKYNLN